MKQVLKITTFIVGTAILVTPAYAKTPVEHVVEQLQRQGFHDIEVTRTMLGRTKIEAKRGDWDREIVMTGAGRILKDEVERDSDDDGDSAGARGGQSSKDDYDDDNDDGDDHDANDDRGDDEEDDESGSGGSGDDDSDDEEDSNDEDDGEDEEDEEDEEDDDS